MNLIIIICSIIALVQTRIFFKGITNAECSILSFIKEDKEGESKISTPKLGGINAIINALNSSYNEFETMKNNQIDEEKYESFNRSRIYFQETLINASKIIKDEQNYKIEYSSKKYMLDIAKKFGEYDSSTGNFTPGSYFDQWKNNSESYIEDVLGEIYSELSQGINENLGLLIQEVIELIKSLYDNLLDIRDFIADQIEDYADDIDKYGKIVYYLFFSLTLFFCILIEILLVYYVFACKGKTCIKIFLHIFWFISAFLMFFCFLLGTFSTFVAKVG